MPVDVAVAVPELVAVEALEPVDVDEDVDVADEVAEADEEPVEVPVPVLVPVNVETATGDEELELLALAGGAGVEEGDAGTHTTARMSLASDTKTVPPTMATPRGLMNPAVEVGPFWLTATPVPASVEVQPVTPSTSRTILLPVSATIRRPAEASHTRKLGELKAAPAGEPSIKAGAPLPDSVLTTPPLMARTA